MVQNPSCAITTRTRPVVLVLKVFTVPSLVVLYSMAYVCVNSVRRYVIKVLWIKEIISARNMILVFSIKLWLANM